MKKLSEMKRPQLSTIIAGLALFLVLGGTAAAAGGLINGKKIKKGTITAKQLKNKTITKGKLKPALVKSLKGKTGPQGAQGAAGAQGEKGEKGVAGAQGIQGIQGIAGQNGVVAPLYAQSGSVNMGVGSTFVTTLNVPAGKYTVTATTQLHSNSTPTVDCAIVSVGGGGDTSDGSSWRSGTPSTASTVADQMITPAGTTQIRTRCNFALFSGDARGTIIATPVQG